MSARPRQAAAAPAPAARRYAVGALRVPSWGTVVLAALLVVGPVAYATAVRGSYAVSGPLDLFTLSMSWGLGLVFPLVAVALYARPLSRELTARYVTVTRTRMPVASWLWWRAAAAAGVGFGVFFLAALVPFGWAFVLDPALGSPGYVQTVAGLSAQEATAYPATVTTFSQLLAVGPWAFGLVFSAWLGVNGAVYAVLGVLLLVVVPNRFVALAVPVVAVLVVGFVMAVAGVPQFSPTVVVPFNLAQFPLWVPLVPLAVTGALLAALGVRAHRALTRGDVLL